MGFFAEVSGGLRATVPLQTHLLAPQGHAGGIAGQGHEQTEAELADGQQQAQATDQPGGQQKQAQPQLVGLGAPGQGTGALHQARHTLAEAVTKQARKGGQQQ